MVYNIKFAEECFITTVEVFAAQPESRTTLKEIFSQTSE